ncbi:interleukin-2 receptor subunit beta isoform X2 [Cheilinus undulatus]|nr:interleukin-2 receptor subunit beta isoform X2 [Cheilinus undulatus]
MKQHENSPPGCSFVFKGEEFTCMSNVPYIRMECNGMLVDNLTEYDPCSHIKMHPPGAPNVSRSANDTLLSWSLGSPHSLFLKSLDFEVKIITEAWKVPQIFPAHKQELTISTKQLKGHCQARVRVKPAEGPNKYISDWSDWSPATSWLEAMDKSTSQDQEGLQTLVTWGMVGLGFLLTATLLLGCCLSQRLHEKKSVPNPSKFFHSLYTVHGGNLKKWMNPLSASESFFTVQPCESISPVELCESWDAVPSTSALLHIKSMHSDYSDTSGVDYSSASSSACFSNMGYFMSSSSGSSAPADPSTAYFTYQDDFHGLHNSHALCLSLCPSFTGSGAYESLKREPQSPDSGFQGDGMFTEDKRVVIKDEVSDDHKSAPLLILPPCLPPQMCAPSPPPTPPNALSLTQVSPDSLPVDEPVEEAGGSYAAWPLGGAVCRSSSMPVENFRTGYLTLKELQTTFSNKSI